MAREHSHDDLKVVLLSSQEVVDLIGLLAAQLAGVPLIGNQGGAFPSLNILENGRIKYRLMIGIDSKEK